MGENVGKGEKEGGKKEARKRGRKGREEGGKNERREEGRDRGMKEACSRI